MEESRCIQTIVRQKEELLRDRLAEITNLINEDEAFSSSSAMENLAAILCRRFSIDLLRTMTADDIYQFVKRRFGFIEASFTNEITVKVSPFLSDTANKQKSAVVLELILKDRPFVVDSLTEYLHEKMYNLGLILYPVIAIEATDEGQITGIRRWNANEDEERAYTFSCCMIRNFDMAEMETLRNDVQALLEMVCMVTDDFSTISQVIEEYTLKPDKKASESLMESERRHLFSWFNEGNVILLGAGEVAKQDMTPELTWDQIQNPLGYTRRRKLLDDAVLPSEIGRLGQYFLESGLEINLIETATRSEVHNKERIQLLFGKRKEKEGSMRINFFQILFTNKSLKEDALAIPLARLKVNSILDTYFQTDTSGSRAGHLTKTAHDFFSIIPKSELFRLDRIELEAIFRQFLFFGDYLQTKISTYTQPARNYARITYCLPHQRFSPDVFQQIDELTSNRLQHSSEIKYWFHLGRNAYSHHIYYFPKGHPQLAGLDTQNLEQEVANLTRSWEEEFSYQLRELETDKAQCFQKRYANVFGVFYHAVFSPQDAIRDIEFLESLLKTGREQVNLRILTDRDESIVYLFSKRKYHLTDIMPYLQNMGLVVIDENTYSLMIDGENVFIYTYYVNHLRPHEAHFPDFTRNFCDLFLAVLEERTENDVLNGLLLNAGMSRNEINLFILYRNYYWQIGAPYLPINKAFLENSGVMIALRDYFAAKFNPEITGEPLSAQALKAEKDRAYKSIYQVKTVAEDIIFKTIFNLMEATLRTNFFNIDEHSTMAIKVKSADVEHMPVPRPMAEIYVHGTDVEGIHLRGAMIARGGLRHSDRHDDFRTEVLGLMNTQMLKNVVIVPEGSKGGFITKRHFEDRQERAADVIQQYKTYINSLLALTDNIVDGKVVPAPGIVRYDGDDTYLVVAADKGTASFSDIANEIAAQRNFWLGDAFASGGQFGYDHKGMAITARGGWESVKYHFLEDGIDIQTTDFSVVGIGDMSGDVFGNGMLLSKHIRLKGAFNHLHIFVDPEPDAATSWQERERLFKTPGSTWMDYDRALISSGGGVFQRNAKTIPLTPEIQTMLDVKATEVSGEELIQLLLKSKVDLLWNGGIGTYIKSSMESTHQVGDAANDAVRIDANCIRARVIGEGGNLGLTQLARLEAAGRGCRLNTDAIDNSGGVDTSDHEVNLKILMSNLIAQKQIASLEERNALLEELTDDIAELVLDDNRGQVQIISMDRERSKKDIKPFVDIVRFLTDQELMDPRTNNMSTTEELEEHLQKGLGVPRPDLAILLSYTKMYFYKELVKSDALADSYLKDTYLGYFPPTLREKYDLSSVQHPLEKEIVGTMLVNQVINQAGVTLLPEISAIVDADAVEIVIAYKVLDDIFHLGQIRHQIMTELKSRDINQAYILKIRLEEFLRDVLIWMLICFKPSELNFSLVETYAAAIDNFRERLDHTLEPGEIQQIQNAVEALVRLGISRELAKSIAKLSHLKNCFEIIVQAEKTGISQEDTSSIVQGLDSLFHFQVLQTRIMGMKLDTNWAKKHRGLLMKQLHGLKQQASAAVISKFDTSLEIDERLQQLMNRNKRAFKQYQTDYNMILNSGSVDLSAMAILLGTISELIA